MTAYDKDEVVLVPFPFSDQTVQKKRPAVVISSNSYNRVSHDIIIMAVTSKIDKTFGIGERAIDNWEAAGLLKPSVIKPAISTIERTLVFKKLGRLSRKDSASVKEALQEIIGI